jgi:signal transduction histidine kinase
MEDTPMCPHHRPADRIGVVVADPALARHQDLVNAAVGTSGLALRNARLQAELRAQLDQVRASRRRIAEAGVTERRKIERDLHDGLQQRLLALTLTLAEVRATTSDPPVLDALEVLRTDLHAAVRELREVAHGVLPAMLAQGGLHPALDDVAERLPLDVQLNIPPGRLSPAVETTAYYIACEGLANVVKHASADHATVSVSVNGNELSLEITDDGCGGADRTGTGLAGLADRARAIGGELTVRSSAEGTLLRAVLPCE